ncbi:uncharacterized protein LOC135329614 [Dromaius novaehollandiae]|uniref:uncharacterized protein LOC135329614 n=1 Tax=Dromaius novaehollandiae TaxID=8790 RepID=UPI00311F9E35
MEGSWTEAISPEQSSLFPTLLQLSTEEIIAIWDAVSNYILEELMQDKGVLLAGLGTFCTVREPLRPGKDNVVTVRRPVFQLEMDMVWLQRLQHPKVTLPDNVKIKPLKYRQLSLATSFSRRVVEDCVQETIRLFSAHVRNKEKVAFAFRDVGVLTCQEDKVHMSFYARCTRWLADPCSLTWGFSHVSLPGVSGNRDCVSHAQPALLPIREQGLHTERHLGYAFCLLGESAKNQLPKSCARTQRRGDARRTPAAVRRIRVRKLQRGDNALPSKLACLLVSRFQLAVQGSVEAQAAPAGCPQEKEQELEEELGAVRSSKERRPGKLLPHREELSLPVLPKWGEGARQQGMESKPAARTLVNQTAPIPGTSPGKQVGVQYLPHPPAGPRRGRAGATPRGAAQDAACPPTQRFGRAAHVSLLKEEQRQHQASWEEQQAALEKEARRQAQITLVELQYALEQRRRPDTDMPGRPPQRQASAQAKQNMQLLTSYKVLRDRWKERVERNQQRLMVEEERRRALVMRHLQKREQQDRVPGSYHQDGFYAWK